MKTVALNLPPWVGSVDFLDPIPLPLVLDLDDALIKLNGNRPEGEQVKTSGSALIRELMRPALACVQAWHVEGQPEVVTFKNFPGSPRDKSRLLSLWVIGEVMKIYNGEAGGLDPTTPGQSSDG